MLEGIFGNASAEKVLLYLEQYEEGYATAIARAFDGMTQYMAQRQLERFEGAGVLVSSLKGRTRLYRWNPRYPFRQELRALLARASRSAAFREVLLTLVGGQQLQALRKQCP